MNAPTPATTTPLCVQNAQREERREPAKDGSNLRALIKSGHLTKRVEVRIIIPEGKHSVRHVILAKRGQYINRDGIAQVLQQECENCVKHLPQYDFRIVVFSPDRFNLIGEIKGLHPALPQDALHSASCAAEDGRRTLTPIDSPASAAFPTDETRSLLPVNKYEDDDLSSHAQCFDIYGLPLQQPLPSFKDQYLGSWEPHLPIVDETPCAPSIHQHMLVCRTCGSTNVVADCIPDGDGDGSLVCPVDGCEGIMQEFAR